jgi:hypothetical protein
LKSVDASVIQAVKQHHMRSSGYSFPERAPNVPINWVAQIIGISDEIAHAVQQLSKDTSLSQASAFSEYLERSVYPKFSLKLVYAARLVLTKE